MGGSVRVVLGGQCRPAGSLTFTLDGGCHTQRCAPCPPPITDPDILDQLIGRVIVRHRTKTGTDDDGVAEYGWTTVYDGPASWSPQRTTEDDPAAGNATEITQVTIPILDQALETTASVWDHDQQRWTVTATTTGPIGWTLDLAREVDHDA